MILGLECSGEIHFQTAWRFLTFQKKIPALFQASGLSLQVRFKDAARVAALVAQTPLCNRCLLR